MARSFLLLLFWTAIALGLRSLNLDSKPPWTDEFATLVLSLGNSFQDVPLGEVLKINELLAILKPLPEANPQGVIDGLLNEDNHPPFYFVLAHLWYQLFPNDGNYLSLAIGRSLPVIFGTLAIPLGYGCAKWIWGKDQERIAQFTALMMAVSPYGIFISQEARHYTFAMLWGLISLTCCLKAGQYLRKKQSLPFYLTILWILVNGLGISVHFFVGLLILAQGLALLFWLAKWAQQGETKFIFCLKSLSPVMAGAIATGLIWVGIIMERGYGRGMTQWIQFTNMSWFNMIFGPFFQLIAAWVTMFCLLPVEASQLFIAILSGLGMLAYFIWFTPVVWQGSSYSLKKKKDTGAILLVTTFIFLVIIYLAITHIAGLDITRGARYSFNFWPLLMLVSGLGLGESYSLKFGKSPMNGLFTPPPSQAQAPPLTKGRMGGVLYKRDKLLKLNDDKKKMVSIFSKFKNHYWQTSRQGLYLPAIILVVGIFSALTITHNLGYRKYYHPDKFLNLLAENPVSETRWIVTTHRSLVQVGELLGVAVEAQRNSPGLVPQLRFVFLPQVQLQDLAPTAKLQTLLSKSEETVDLWLVNYFAPVDFPHCQADQSPRETIFGYSYQRFHCPNKS